MEGRLDKLVKLKEMMGESITPEEYLKIAAEDIAGDYAYTVEQAKIAARTGTELAMQKYATQQAMDRARYEAEQALKQQLNDAFVYGTGAIQQTYGSGYAGTGGAGGGTSLSKSDLEDAIRYAYQNLNGRDTRHTLSGKEQCPVLIRCLRELFINPTYSLRYSNLSLL